MKLFKIVLYTILISGFWLLTGSADRLYTWKDKNGVTHISQEPPPQNARLVDTMDYKEVAPPLRDQLPTDQQQGDSDRINAEEDKSTAASGTDEVSGEDVYYEDDGDRNKRKERKKEKPQEHMKKDDRQASQEQRQSGSDDRLYYINKSKQQRSAGQDQQPGPSDNRETGSRK